MVTKKNSSFFKGFKVSPLPGSFLLIGVFGFFFSTLFLRLYSQTWAFTIGFISVMIFIASFISMTKAEVPEELLIKEHLVGKGEKIVYMSKKEYDEYMKKKRSSGRKSSSSSTSKKVSSKKSSSKKSSPKKTSSSKKRVSGKNNSKARGGKK